MLIEIRNDLLWKAADREGSVSGVYLHNEEEIKIMKKSIVTLLLAAVMAVSLPGCGKSGTDAGNDIMPKGGDVSGAGEENKAENNEDRDSKEADEESDVSDVGNEASDVNPGAGGQKELPEYAGTGEMISSNIWDMVILYAKEYDSIAQGAFKPMVAPEGTTFLTLFFEFKNVSPGLNFPISYFEFAGEQVNTAQLDGIEPNRMKVFSDDLDGMHEISGDVGAGKMAKGWLCYQVPSDWETFEIEYMDAYGILECTTHKAPKFVIKKEEVVPADYVYPDSVFPYDFDNAKVTEKGTKVSVGGWTIELDDVVKDNETEFYESLEEGYEHVIFYMTAESEPGNPDLLDLSAFEAKALFYIDGYAASPVKFREEINGYSNAYTNGYEASEGTVQCYLAVTAPVGWKNIELTRQVPTDYTEIDVFAVVNE